MRITRNFLLLLSITLNVFLFSFFLFHSLQLKSWSLIEIQKTESNNIVCNNTLFKKYLGQRGQYWVLYNFLIPTRIFKCDETVTYTTTADMTFLEKLVPLLERWKGPVSIALYTPETDLVDTLERIHYLRQCSSPLVKEFVSFHLFFEQNHIPENLTNIYFQEWPEVVCSNELSFSPYLMTFRRENKLLYPINVGRNIAREMATTHYVLAADITLYPSVNLIPRFLEMINRNTGKGRESSTTKVVFVLPHFEVESNLTTLPETKKELQLLLEQNVAVPFHKYSCSACHGIPRQEEWQEMEVKEDASLNIFHIGKRINGQKYWEPFYIGTKEDPMFDERLSLEGKENKMTQNYIMCLLDYEYHILDNAFLVHTPGIQRQVVVPTDQIVKEQYEMILKTITPELHRLYGMKTGCDVLI